MGRQRSRRRVPENSRRQRHRLELLDGSVGPSGRGACKCTTGENFAGRGCRCRPRPGTRRLQRLPHPLERRRPRHPYPEASQSRVREAGVAFLSQFASRSPECRTGAKVRAKLIPFGARSKPTERIRDGLLVIPESLAQRFFTI
jgi:hypothetical protein